MTTGNVSAAAKEPECTTTSNVVKEDVSAPLSQLFRKPEGSWTCESCYCSNSKDATSCIACQTVRPGHQVVPESTAQGTATADVSQPIGMTEVSVSQSTFTFGFPTANTTTPAFNFGLINSTTPVTPVSTVNSPPKDLVESKEPEFPALNLSGKFSFADLAKNTNSPSTFSFGNSSSSQPFSGAGAPLFSSLTPVAKSSDTKNPNVSGNAEDGEDDFVPTAEFQPVIPLPPLVEVKKGDEDENTIAEYRTKLYRYMPETKEWKERGVGNVKLLQSKTDANKCRVVMWREKIGKLACNFSLYPDIKVTNYQNNPKVLCWKCQDFAEEPPTWETFTLRFGNEDNCGHFKSEMERLAKLTVATANGSPSAAAKESSAASVTETNQVAVPLSQLFKKPEGSWNCESCYCSNNKDATSCVACQTVRPGHQVVPESTAQGTAAVSQPTGIITEVSVSQPTFSFGFPATSTTAPTFNFGFTNSATSSAPVSVVDGNTSKTSEETKESGFPALNLSGKFSFADLAKNTNSPSTFSFGNSSSSQPFSGAGAPLFSSLTPVAKSSDAKNANVSGNAEDGEDDFVPTAEFQPVIPLPPLVEVKKGDEDENTIAEYRTKLYRYMPETKEWKERGVGNVKLLQSKTDANKCRIVMWREKIGKLACNFSLYPDIKVTNYQNNPKVLCWKCQDFVEEPPTWETFTLRFGNEDNCAHFKSEMERLAKLTVVPAQDSPSAAAKEPVSTVASVVETVPVSLPLSQLFKKPEGSWNCESCYCSNNKDATSCIACQTVRPGHQVVPESTTTGTDDTGTSKPAFSFGFPAANTAAPTFNIGFVNSTTSVAPPSLIDSNASKTLEETKEHGFPALNLSGKFSFADLAKNTNSPSTFSFGNSSSSQPFSGAGAPLFSSLTPVTRSSDMKNANVSGNAEDGEDDFVPTAEFQPVIPLPPMVEVKKGDENENTIAEYRTKLYRYMPETKEWKERGVGNVKLLQSKTDANKCRVVMWREKIGKLACNFSLYPDIKVTNYQNNPKVLCWKCQDFAEEPPTWETFTLRFGNEDNCGHFKSEMERLAKLTVATANGSPSAAAKESTAASVVETNQVAVPLSQLFKKPEGSWNCESCYCSNNKDATSCLSCQTRRPGMEKESTNQNDVDTSPCPGCIGCNSDTYTIPEIRKLPNDEIIELPLTLSDSSNASPSVVTLSMFTSSEDGCEVKTENEREDIGAVNSTNDQNVNNSFTNFSFSFQSPEANTSNSFQFKTPTFSFKPDGNSSIFGGGGGSIFTPPVGGNQPGNTPSPFVSPFSQQSSFLNNSGFSFSTPLFNQQSSVQSPNNENPPAQREEDEYEDVDDEEEDECMFEDDAHVYIQDDADSGEDFVDKGEAVIRILYDGDSYCAQLLVMVDGETIAEHLVAAETTLETKGSLSYEWTGICNYESPIKSRIKAVFHDEDAFNSFTTVMADSLEFAKQAGITEAVLLDDTAGGY